MPFAAVNGTRLHYHVTGREGVPIVCIHPPLLNEENFNYQKAQLSDNHKVVTFDIRGHGHSPYSELNLTYPLIVEDMKQLLDFLELDQVILLGYSTGGGIALEAMLTHPQRFAGAVLVSSMSETTGALLRGRIALASGLATIGGKRLLGGAISWGNADMSKTFENLYLGAVNGDRRNIRQYYNYSLKFNCSERLKEIKQPVLLLYGSQDHSYRRYADILHEGLQNSTLQFIEGVGHQIPTKAPRNMHRIMESWISNELDIGPESRDDERRENYLQDIPDYLPDADTPSAKAGHQEI